MKTVTLSQFMSFRPCWKEDRIRAIAGDKAEWTAMDVLNLENVPADDRLWSVLREEFIPARILHEFKCRCAEQALALIEHPDSRSVDAIAAKRAWMRGEISDKQLDVAARAAAHAAVRAAHSAARAAYSAARAAYSAVRAAADDAYYAAAYSADAAAYSAARAAAHAAARAAADDACAVARNEQVAMLKKMLEE
ncbi:MAG TPA: hypothetical protein PKL77_06150 [Candidatus Omnitrophota bacterium]|nr:hypothetical protein [Candidatus Omnitrophota bacterium]